MIKHTSLALMSNYVHACSRSHLPTKTHHILPLPLRNRNARSGERRQSSAERMKKNYKFLSSQVLEVHSEVETSDPFGESVHGAVY